MWGVAYVDLCDQNQHLPQFHMLLCQSNILKRVYQAVELVVEVPEAMTASLLQFGLARGKFGSNCLAP